jgi:4'-phosphopantetheinyl transferase
MRAVALSPGLPPMSAPARGEVHVLLVYLREAAGAERGLRCFLSRDEIERAARFQSEGARSRFVLTRAWLRVILARCLDATPERITFSFGGNGKPALAEEWRHRELSFNVSHSEDYALIGLTSGRAIGVDIEQVRPMPDFAEITSGFFSESEMRAIEALPEPDRLRGFFRCWTRKEAFMKATGDGMAIALDGFSVSLDDDAERSIVMADSRLPHGDAWTVTGLSLLPECEAAVAVEGAAARVSAWRDPVRL